MQGVLLVNSITVCRGVVAAWALITGPVMAVQMLIVHLCVWSDAIDGFLARKWKAESRFGDFADSLADIPLYAIILLAIFPPVWAYAVLVFGVVSYFPCRLSGDKWRRRHGGCSLTLQPIGIIASIVLLSTLEVKLLAMISAAALGCFTLALRMDRVRHYTVPF